jgi:hypothetical protein
VLDVLDQVPVAVWTGLSLGSLAGLVFAALALPRVVGRLPEAWFLHPPPPFAERLRAAPGGTLARNLLAVALLAAGIAMLFLPGQGVLTILAGLLISDLPLRDRLVRALVSRARIARALQRLRRWAGAPPFLGLSTGDEGDAAG